MRGSRGKIYYPTTSFLGMLSQLHRLIERRFTSRKLQLRDKANQNWLKSSMFHFCFIKTDKGAVTRKNRGMS